MLGTYGDGCLYVMSDNATEPDVMCFRSTVYEADPVPEPTPQPQPEPTPEPQPTPAPEPQPSTTRRATSKLPQIGDNPWYPMLLPLAVAGACLTLAGLKLRKKA